jgi:hypothetical protein
MLALKVGQMRRRGANRRDSRRFDFGFPALRNGCGHGSP